MECILKLEGYKDRIVNFQSFPLKGDVIQLEENEFEVSYIKHVLEIAPNIIEDAFKGKIKIALDKGEIGHIEVITTHIFCRKNKSI